MLTSTVALLALLTPAFASPIDRRAPANPVIPAHLRRRAPASADTVFNPNSSALDNAKYIPLNPKRTPRVKPSATSTTSSWTEAWTSVPTASTTVNQPTSTTPWTSVAPSATSTGWVSPFDLSWKAQGWSFFDSFNGFPYDGELQRFPPPHRAPADRFNHPSLIPSPTTRRWSLVPALHFHLIKIPPTEA